ncbi:hypothetical protein EVAR_5933_1 [Eumeta japonica]|uniref:Uncharacterized protein n=1 Tax=Eumeta variegata TaxID=151549 RepID=A0A4C1TC57_EUMVA|nr:hypothetical protein EVAR_5933_1 [Eumeta japonica]
MKQKTSVERLFVSGHGGSGGGGARRAARFQSALGRRGFGYLSLVCDMKGRTPLYAARCFEQCITMKTHQGTHQTKSKLFSGNITYIDISICPGFIQMRAMICSGVEIESDTGSKIEGRNWERYRDRNRA